MRAAGVVALFLGITGALGGLAYAAFSSLREWTVLEEKTIAAQGTTTVRVAAKPGRTYWAAVELFGAVQRTPLDHDIALKTRVVDPSGTAVRAVDVHLDANAKLPTCFRFASDDGPCALILLEGRARDRIHMTTQIAPVTTTANGDLSYEIDLGRDTRGGVIVENAKVTVYRNSRDEAIAGLMVALVAAVLAGIAFRADRRSGLQIGIVAADGTALVNAWPKKVEIGALKAGFEQDGTRNVGDLAFEVDAREAAALEGAVGTEVTARIDRLPKHLSTAATGSLANASWTMQMTMKELTTTATGAKVAKVSGNRKYTNIVLKRGTSD